MQKKWYKTTFNVMLMKNAEESGVQRKDVAAKRKTENSPTKPPFRIYCSTLPNLCIKRRITEGQDHVGNPQLGEPTAAIVPI